LAMAAALLLMFCGIQAFAQGDWKRFTSSKGGFNVLMPGTPKESVEFLDEEKKLALYQFLVEKEQGNIAYLTTYSDYNPDDVKRVKADTLLDNASEGARNAVKGKVVRKQKITLNGNPGLEFEFDLPDNGKYIARIYLVKARLYQTIYVGVNNRTKKADAMKYITSFRLNSQ
jgi:hypothetical protein